MVRKLVVKRKAYARKAYVRKAHKRKAFTIKRNGKIIRIPATTVKKTKVPKTRVSATKFKIKDLGLPGRGKKVIEIKRKGILKSAGYGIYKSAKQRHKALRKVDKKVGTQSLFRMLQAQVILRKRIQRPEQARIFEADRNWVEKNLLSRKEALSMTKKARTTWKKMPSKERKKRMPSRK